MAENENKNEIAEAKTTALSTFDDSLLSGGTGLEETTTEDFAIPFIRVLQPMSPQLQKKHGSFVEGASAGDLYNTVTGEAFDGDKGISIIPCAYNKKYIEWIPREKGGGLVNAGHDISILSKCTRDDESRRYYTPEGNEIVETAQFFILVVAGETAQQAVLAFTSTQLGVSRKWLTMLRMARVQNSKGESVEAPMFAYTYRLTTTTQSNDKGSWNGYSINQEGATDMSLAMMAKDFMGAARSGDVEVKQEQQNDIVSDTI
jgi:hypothetical protein|tara:strand:+ start:3284 stop:4063 length:780 start_codon:yes stop_codon:yes gene_type:complete